MINRERLAETFTTLVMIDSISRQEARISEAICRMLAPWDPEIQVDGAGSKTGSDTGNLIMRIAGDENIPPLMLNAHMDTVEPGKGVVPEFSDGVFTSRGDTILGADDKSAIAIIIESLKVIEENGLPHGPIELVFTICEEIGLLGAKNLDFDLITAPFGYALDTSDTDAIITRAPAANQFEINLYGKDAHAGADPERGINAILLASQAIARLSLGRIDEETTCNIGVVEALGATNIVPRHVLVKGEVRSHDEGKLKRVTDTIISAFADVVNDYRSRQGLDDLPRFDVSIHKEFASTQIPDNAPLVSLVQQAAEGLGRTIAPKRTGGGSDANIFFENGVAAGVLGTGMTDIHSTRESIRLDDMVKGAELLVEIIKKHGENAG
ncbi:MAG: M20/M25/M40 family metallo-hydrolase [Desulfobacterales bacterium]|nr:M20/M25/M40 family metallo-hydrolase [Desulfobacterales bacterium]